MPKNNLNQLDLFPVDKTAANTNLASPEDIAKLQKLDRSKVELSDKMKLYEAIFWDRWDEEKQDFKYPDAVYVTKTELLEKLRELKETQGLKIKLDNAANPFKDTIRHYSRNQNWSNEMHIRGVSGRQSFGEERIMEFTRYKQGQIEPFPDEFPHDDDFQSTLISVSPIPVFERKFLTPRGGSVAKVIKELDLVGHHLRRFQPFNDGMVARVSYVESNVAGKYVEIDLVYGYEMLVNGIVRQVMLSVEMKRMDEVIIGDQIRAQIVKLGYDCRRSKALAAYKPTDFIIAIAVAPRMIAGQEQLCMWSTKPIPVNVAAQTDPMLAHELEYEIAGREAFRFDEPLNIF